MKRLIYLLAALPLLLAGCNSDDGMTPQTGGTPVEFSAQIATRAAGTAWDNGDQMGVFMKTAGQNLGSQVPLANNVLYTNGGSGFITTTPIYYPQSGVVDFVAYYPYVASFGTPYIYKVDVTSAKQTTPAAIDLLYSNNATNKSRSATAVGLAFNHMLARVVLNVKGDGTTVTNTDLTGISVAITGMPSEADFALADGTFANLAGVANITPLSLTVQPDYAATLSAIMIPQKVSDNFTGRRMIFTIGSDMYTYDIPNGDVFESGNNYPYTITVSKTGIKVTPGNITPWTGTTGTPDNMGIAQDLQTVLIKAGSFQMGSPQDEPNRYSDETQHSVTLTKDFYMSKYEITNAQYAAFLNANNIGSDGKWVSGSYPGERLISQSSGSYDWGLHWDGGSSKWIPVAGYENHPVIYVTWYGASEYARWIGGSLPTEAQWEYACRGAYPNKAGETATKPFGLGDGTKLDYTMANFQWRYPYTLPGGEYTDNTNTYPGKTMPVGSYAANNYGLYDMHGNVYEWCSDWYGGAYGSGPVTDPTGSTSVSYRVLRGGDWSDSARYCRSAYRYGYYPDFASGVIGFRVVFVP